MSKSQAAGKQWDVILEGMMKNSCKADEQISAFADSELDVSQHDALLEVLRDPQALRVWENYHCIGEVLRSSEAAVVPSAEFAGRMVARLADESIHSKSEERPAALPIALATPCGSSYGAVRRLAIPGAAIAATVILAISVSLNNVSEMETSVLHDIASSTAIPSPVVMPAIHEAPISEYLVAHQRFSPFLYTTAHYARFVNSSSE